MSTVPHLPRTVSSWWDPFLIGIIAVVAYIVLSPLSISTTTLSVLVVAAIIAVMAPIEWLRTPKHTISYSLAETFPRTFVSWLGTLGGFGLVLIGWSTLTEYRRTNYLPLFHVLPLFLLLTPVVSLVCIIAADRIFGSSLRGGYQLGLVMIGRIREVDWYALRDYLLMWFIRGFFLATNFCTLVWTIGSFRGQELSVLGGSWIESEYYLLIMLYAVIIAAVIPGYLFGSRLIGTETKAVSHSGFGWMATLACYSPFFVAFGTRWFNFDPITPDPVWAQPWVLHSLGSPLLAASIGAFIFLFGFIHFWGEAQFGLRSSILSNRGIITTGPYRFTKHPVYAAKCMAWLLIWMPFLSGIDMLDGIRLTLLWVGVCSLFFVRALTEEQLLSADPVYVAYALWIDEHGIFKELGRRIPPMSFAWRLKYWQRTAPSASGEASQPR